jgi:hypothetical protein
MNRINDRTSVYTRPLAYPEIDERVGSPHGFAEFSTEMQRLGTQSVLRHALVQFKAVQWTSMHAFKRELTQK